MRQIVIGAWLVLASSAMACTGQEFAPSGASDNDDEADSAPSKSGGGSTTTSGNAGGSSRAGSANGSAGQASKGGSGSVVPPAFGGSGGSSSSSGGSSGTDTNEECLDSKVIFRMVPGPDLPPDYVCDAGCGTGWLTITDAMGASALSIFPSCGTASCESCELLPCAAAACLPALLTAEGTELTWSGTFLASDTCGMNMACQRATCVTPGRYKAKACANVNAGESSMNAGCVPKDGVMLCSEVEFDFPGTEEVRLLLEKP